MTQGHLGERTRSVAVPRPFRATHSRPFARDRTMEAQTPPPRQPRATCARRCPHHSATPRAPPPSACPPADYCILNTASSLSQPFVPRFPSKQRQFTYPQPADVSPPRRPARRPAATRRNHHPLHASGAPRNRRPLRPWRRSTFLRGEGSKDVQERARSMTRRRPARWRRRGTDRPPSARVKKCAKTGSLRLLSTRICD